MAVVTFRELTEDDFELLAHWLGREHVQAWWRDPSAPSTVAQNYGPRIRGETRTEVFVVRLEHTDVGMIQRYRIADHADWLQCLAQTGFDASQAAGIDYLLGDLAAIGRGVGTEMIRSFTNKLFAEIGDITTIAVTPQAANTASCRVLEKAGYRQHWVGMLDSDDPADEGEAALYVRSRHDWSVDRFEGPAEVFRAGSRSAR